MAYKTILAHCDAGEGTARRVEVAALLAERLGSRLIGLHVHEPFKARQPVASGAMDSLLAAHNQAVAAERKKARSMFDLGVKKCTVDTEWRSVEGHRETIVPLQARYADMTVVGLADTAATAVNAGLPELTALGSGRGVLVVPAATRTMKTAGTTAMICWDGSREAARAAWDSLPLLEKADKVFALVVGAESDAEPGGQLGTDLAVWLLRHGIKATLDRTPPLHGNVGSAILAYAVDRGIDLLVAGVYGHSRLREFVLGGTSRTLLSSTPIPLFISH